MARTLDGLTAQVHDDVFKVLKFSLSEWSIISAEAGNKYLNLYRNFLEPFLRLPPRDDEGIKEKESDEDSDDKVRHRDGPSEGGVGGACGLSRRVRSLL